MKKHNLEVGSIYGKLTVLNPDMRHPTRRGVFALCKCECGTEKLVSCYQLVNNVTVSCGCHRASQYSKIATKHGLGTDYIYMIWWNMKSRCTDPKNNRYEHYGAKGVTVYPPWLNNVATFAKDIKRSIGDRPADTYFLDRIDNTKGYEPDNVRWASTSLSAANRLNESKVRWTVKRGGNKFRAEIVKNEIRHRTPDFNTHIEAAIAADFLVVKLWKDAIKHSLNFPQFYDKYKKAIFFQNSSPV